MYSQMALKQQVARRITGDRTGSRHRMWVPEILLKPVIRREIPTKNAKFQASKAGAGQPASAGGPGGDFWLCNVRGRERFAQREVARAVRGERQRPAAAESGVSSDSALAERDARISRTLKGAATCLPDYSPILRDSTPMMSGLPVLEKPCEKPENLVRIGVRSVALHGL